MENKKEGSGSEENELGYYETAQEFLEFLIRNQELTAEKWRKSFVISALRKRSKKKINSKTLNTLLHEFEDLGIIVLYTDYFTIGDIRRLYLIYDKGWSDVMKEKNEEYNKKKERENYEEEKLKFDLLNSKYITPLSAFSVPFSIAAIIISIFKDKKDFNYWYILVPALMFGILIYFGRFWKNKI